MTIFVVMIVVVAFYVGVISKRTVKQCLDCFVSGTVNAAKELDTCIGKCHLCATADTAAGWDLGDQSTFYSYSDDTWDTGYFHQKLAASVRLPTRAAWAAPKPAGLEEIAWRRAVA